MQYTDFRQTFGELLKGICHGLREFRLREKLAKSAFQLKSIGKHQDVFMKKY